MAEPTVVDELVVKLRLDAEEYEKAEKKVEQETGRTFRKQQDRARQTDRTNRDQQRRLKDVAAGVKGFATVVMGAVGIVTGLGVAVGGVLTGLLNFDTGLRRQAVGTGLSNRQMQAWSATARRMGADASAGAEAMAALAKERQQFELTGNAPTMQALSRMGINVSRGRSLEDILTDAQRMYRAAPAGQRQQFENTLAAQGVSADLIIMIKSETDARDAYAKSLQQAREENEKASAAWADTLETLKSAGIKAAGILQDILAPAIENGAVKLVELAVELDQFAKDVKEAGGGIDGFMIALDKHAPVLAASLQVMGDITSVVVDQLKLFWQALKDLGTWVRYFLNMSRAPWGTARLGDDLAARLSQGGNAVADWWRGRVASARANSSSGMESVYRRNLEGMPRNIDDGSAGAGAAFAGGSVSSSAKDIMNTLTSQYGLSVAQAAAVVANWQAESGLKTNAFNGAGGGTGARGLAQWRGARSQAFKQRFGVMPDQGSLAQQIEFAMTDPYERSLMLRSFAGGGDAAALGTSYSKIFEAHGNVREDARRGQLAGQLAGAGGSTSTVNIQNMTVQTNDPAQLVQGLQRIDTTQPYNTVVR